MRPGQRAAPPGFESDAALRDPVKFPAFLIKKFLLPFRAWNDCPDSAIFIPNRFRIPMSGAPTPASSFSTNGATTARRYGFREYDGPPLEPLELFTTKSGEEIVGQLYNFTDKGERAVALRPEMTPTLARMVAAHERNYKKPIKWFAIPQLFRYERQQKGRLREHFQFNADLIGETNPAADAELIALLIDTLRSFGLTESDFVIRLSSRNAWSDFFKQGRGDAATRIRILSGD